MRGMRPDELTFEPNRAALLVVDFQEKLAAAMPQEHLRVAENNIAILVELARRMDMPVVVSEQYPKGLGHTMPRVLSAVEQGGTRLERLEKIELSCTGSQAFVDIEARLSRDTWIVTGMETHVCVYQTVRGLREMGRSVHVPSDAVCSRRPENYALGLALSEKAGAIVTSTEIVLFDALKVSGTDDFKALTKLIR